MIITLTPNPSLDKTVELDSALIPGAVQRAVRTTSEPGGKGVNISRALTAAGHTTVAVLPGDASDPVLTALNELAVPHHGVPLGESVRTNITVTDLAGTTTKINEPGPQFTQALTASLIEHFLASAEGASWVALAGSLPPGVPDDLYAQMITVLRQRQGPTAPRIAVDSSGPALAAAVAAGPDLIKPNAEELLELVEALTGQAPTIEVDRLEGRPADVFELVRQIQPYGVQAALVTLGAHGAVLVRAADHVELDSGQFDVGEPPALFAWGPQLETRSTVGAGDASLAGHIAAQQQGCSPQICLQQAMTHGRAAAALPGSTMPRPEDLTPSDVTVEELYPNPEREPA